LDFSGVIFGRKFQKFSTFSKFSETMANPKGIKFPFECKNVQNFWEKWQFPQELN